MKSFLVFIIFCLSIGLLSSQHRLSGSVVDDEGKPVMGASVSMENSTIATLTGKRGRFVLDNLPTGEFNLIVTFSDYGNSIVELILSGDHDAGKIVLERQAPDLDPLQVFSGMVKKESSTLLYDNVGDKKLKDIYFDDQFNLLNRYSSVFVSPRGGGAGDQRISVRGFDQDNIGFMLNGIPLNDDLNGNINWSDWSGIFDFASSAQLQKGMGNALVGNRAIGGLVSVATGDGSEGMGMQATTMYSSGNTFRISALAGSGLINDIFSIRVGAGISSGDGMIDKTWHDRKTFYLGSRLNIAKNHEIGLYAFLAPQSHGIAYRPQNIATFSKEFAENISGFNSEALSVISEEGAGRSFNSGWNSIGSSYAGRQFRNGEERDRRFSDFINLYEGYSQKPMLNVLWTAQWNSIISQTTSLYYIGGRSEMSDYAGDLQMIRAPGQGGIPDFQATISQNNSQNNAALINNVSDERSYGGISRLNFAWNRFFTSNAGIDIKNSQFLNYGQIRDLLGGQYLPDNSSEFRSDDYRAGLGDTILYNNYIGIIRTGAFLDSEFANDELAVNLMAAYYGSQYSLHDKFRRGVDGGSAKDSLNHVNSGILHEITARLGAKYFISDEIAAFGNFGFKSRPGLLNDVIRPERLVVASEPASEYFLNYELGAQYRSPDNAIVARLGLFVTSWNNRVMAFDQVKSNGDKDLYYVPGISTSNRGVDIEVLYKPLKNLGINFAGTYMNNKYTGRVSDSYATYESGSKVDVPLNFYILNLNSGIAPSLQLKLAAIWEPIMVMQATLSGRHMRDYYSTGDILRRNVEKLDESGKIVQNWKIPAFSVFDFNLIYQLPLKSRFGITIFADVNNVFDALYISDAWDSGLHNGYIIRNATGEIINDHAPERAEVFSGLPRNFNIGARFVFK
jgi:hypothetical protein